MLIAIVSDTHMPRGNRRLPQNCVELLNKADLIVHAGDFVTLAVLEQLRSYGDVVAVHGNVDGRDLRTLLPPTATFDAGGATIAVVHDGGPRLRRLQRLQRRFPDADAVVFGHSHVPLHERSPDGFQIFNPGSPTDRRTQPEHTMGIARVDGSSIELEHVSLGP